MSVQSSSQAGSGLAINQIVCLYLIMHLWLCRPIYMYLCSMHVWCACTCISMCMSVSMHALLYVRMNAFTYIQWRRPGAEFRGDGRKKFRGPRFLNDVFSGKISIFTPKISDDLFLVIDHVFQILRFFTVLNVLYNPFFTIKTTISENNSLITPFFYSFRTFTRIQRHYFSKYWGTNAWAIPPPQIFWVDRPPSPP